MRQRRAAKPRGRRGEAAPHHFEFKLKHYGPHFSQVGVFRLTSPLAYDSLLEFAISRRFVAKGVPACSEGKGNAGSSGRAGESWACKQQKYYERSQYVIENAGTHLQNELIRTPNEPQLSAEMRAFRVEFEFSSTLQVLARTERAADKIARTGRSSGVRENTKIVGTNLRTDL